MRSYLQPMAVVLTVLVMTSSSVSAVAGGPTILLYLSSAQHGIGDEIDIEVRMDPKTYEVTGAELHLVYPAGAFEYVSLESGPSLPVQLGQPNSGTGTADITIGSNIGEPMVSPGTIAVLTLRALQSGSHQITLSEDTQTTAVGEVQDVTDTLTGATVLVGGGEASGQTTVQPGAASGDGSAETSAQSGTTTGPTSVTQAASQVETGPEEAFVLGLVFASITALAYVGYTSTDLFRHSEASEIARQSEDEGTRGNFNS